MKNITDDVIEQLKQENARLKELFKLAFRDAKYYENEYCSLCGTSECPTKCTQKEDCIFKHQDEIKKLISDK